MFQFFLRENTSLELKNSHKRLVYRKILLGSERLSDYKSIRLKKEALRATLSVEENLAGKHSGSSNDQQVRRGLHVSLLITHSQFPIFFENCKLLLLKGKRREAKKNREKEGNCSPSLKMISCCIT